MVNQQNVYLRIAAISLAAALVLIYLMKNVKEIPDYSDYGPLPYLQRGREYHRPARRSRR